MIVRMMTLSLCLGLFALHTPARASIDPYGSDPIELASLKPQIMVAAGESKSSAIESSSIWTPSSPEMQIAATLPEPSSEQIVGTTAWATVWSAAALSVVALSFSTMDDL